MADALVASPLPNLKSVYDKWESRNSYFNSTRASGDGLDKGYWEATNRGRHAWRNKFGDVGPAPVRRTRQQRRRNQQQPLSIHSITNSAIGHFKVYPTATPVTGRMRPFMGRCCSCLPQSKNSLYDDSVAERGTVNILFLPSSNRDLISRISPVISHTLSRPLNHQYTNVDKQVLTSQRVTDAIQKTADQILEQGERKMHKEVEKSLFSKAKYKLRSMKASISNKLIRLTGWFLHKLLGRLLSAILVQRGQLEMLKQASKSKVPLIYLPCHRSHLDYILLTFITYHWDIKAPHVAAGENLNITFFGKLMRGLGGFFIRRTLDKSGRKDLVYRALLQTYMEELLCAGEDLEFFIEGTRSRSGKAVYPKGGLLSIIVDSYIEGKIDDAYIVPVSISYEKILDGNFNGQQIGEAKASESFWRAWAAIWKVFNAKFGNVRVDFCQPFSLKEYIQVAQSFSNATLNASMSSSQISLDEQATGESGSSALIHRVNSSPRGSDQLFYGTDIVVEDMRTTIQGLADHVIYNQAHNQAVMSTHLLAFLLLTKHRQGASKQQVMKSFDWLKIEVVNKKRDLGFVGKTSDVITHACRLLNSVVQTSSTEEAKQASSSSEDLSLILKPVISLPCVFELAYYANNVSFVFLKDSLLANVIYSLVDAMLWTNQGYETNIVFTHQALTARAIHLAQLLKYEFIVKTPCSDWDTVISSCIDGFLDTDVIRPLQDDDESCGTYERNRYKSLAQSLSCNDGDSEDEVEYDTTYKLMKSSEESMERFWFLKSVLAPVLECYHITACNLKLLQEKEYTESEYVTTVHNVLKERAQSGAAQYNECAAIDTLKNCLRVFEQQKVLDYYRDESNTRMLQLNKKYSDNEKLNAFIYDIQTYRS